MKTINGQCLCGAVKFNVVLKSANVSTCHCSMCRRWSGGVLLFIDASHSLTFEQKDKLKYYNSSAWGKRGFCQECGSSILWQTQDETMTHISFGTLHLTKEESDTLVLTSEYFIDKKPNFYAFLNPTEKYTEEDITRMYSEI